MSIFDLSVPKIPVALVCAIVNANAPALKSIVLPLTEASIQYRLSLESPFLQAEMKANEDSKQMRVESLATFAGSRQNSKKRLKIRKLQNILLHDGAEILRREICLIKGRDFSCFDIQNSFLFL